MKNLIYPCLRKSFILIITIIIKQYIACSQTTFQRILDDTSTVYERGSSVIQTYDYGYLILADITGFQPTTLLIKTNNIGKVEWAKKMDKGISICHAIDGGYIIAEYGLTKIDSLGNVQWRKTYGGGLASVQQTSDSGYIAVGSGVLIKTDLNGDTIWTRQYVGGWGISVDETYDKGFIVAGSSSLGAGDNDVFLSYFDSSGNNIWSKTYGEWQGDMGWYVEQTLDSGFIITGRTHISSGTADSDIFLIKTDNSGNIQWAKTYERFGCEYWGYVVHQLNDGGYIVLGDLVCMGTGDWAVLLNIDSIGNIRWERYYDDIRIAANNFSLTSDGGYIITGRKIISPGYGIDLLKTDSAGNSGCNESIKNSGVSSVNFLVSSWSFSTTSGAIVVTDTINVNSIAIIDSILCIVCSDTPVANFGYVAPITNSTIQFYDSSQIASSWYWNFGDGNNDIIQNPIHTYTDTGFYNVCLTVYNDCGSDTLCKTIRIDSVVTNIREYLFQKAIKVYPNPNSSEFIIEILSRNKVKILQISVLNINGQVIYEEKQLSQPYQKKINLIGYAKGIYNLRIVTDSCVINKKLVIE
ncbi:MAG: T9SS type A sorting domain-containing protein [Cytophagales bacterium]|nr:T9SS type A sorting domain-containing protein [Cytophagales bacterium]